MRKKIVAGNWKLNGNLQENQQLISALLAGGITADVEMVVCPPFPYLTQVGTLLQGKAISLGAQNVADQTKGAYTGEVSAPMLKEFAVRYVLVGHSERRAYYGDSDQSVSKRFQQALAAGLTPVLCIGETLEERQAGSTESVLQRQLDAVLQLCGVEAFNNAVIAYEPVWAIGTGQAATSAQAQSVHAFIRGLLAQQNPSVAAQCRILYGGSVKASNAAELFSQADIDGGLIGGAALIAEEFLGIYRSAR